MYLKRLEISGFKSFPTKTFLEFPQGVTAVVGPNGSGKSNIADALRWVLGEQSMLKLRTKKGEELIFTGSQSKSRLSKALVTLALDNIDRRLPFEFEEISIARKVYRDGQNQYFINGSEVRLKDVAELIAKAKLGLKGYTIINQGMSDVILYSSPKERREIFEEALGLKEYQLKKKEAIDKLQLSTINLKQAASLIQETAPHLKFLKKQVAKIEKRDEILAQLRSQEENYFLSQMHSLDGERKTLSGVLEELEKSIISAQKEFDSISETINQQESRWNKELSGYNASDTLVADLERRSIELSKELGKIEGLLEAGIAHTKVKPINREKLTTTLKEILGLLDGFEEKPSEELKKIIRTIMPKFEALLNELQDDQSKQEGGLEQKRVELTSQLKTLQSEIIKAKAEFREEAFKEQRQRQQFAKLHVDLRLREHELSQLETRSHRLNLEKEQFLVKEGEFKQFFGPRFDELLAIYKNSAPSPVGHTNNPDELRKNIERLKVRLELAGEIDPETQKEYEKLNERHTFLTQQTTDLEASIEDLRKVIQNLETHMEGIFDEAFEHIKHSFNNYFQILFGGGKATLAIIKERNTELGEDAEDGALTLPPELGGIEIKVELPGKKIKGLNMLSGGERALTSVALLLALVSTSPPPFMVLDEVDASLDESNSQRFAKILMELKKNTQFVIVTHNREVMKEADVLYGVTMEEEGVSKLISLQLAKAEQYAQ